MEQLLKTFFDNEGMVEAEASGTLPAFAANNNFKAPDISQDDPAFEKKLGL